MRKHFLILMLMALLPLAGWANDGDITSTPVPANDLTYHKTLLNLVVAGEVEGGADYSMYYAVVENPTSATLTPVAGEFSAGIPQRTDAGTYRVVYAVHHSGTTTPVAAQYLDVTIEKAPLAIILDNATKKYGDPDPVGLPWTAVNPSQFQGDDNANNLVLTFTLKGVPTDAPAKAEGYAYTMTGDDPTTITNPNYAITTSSTPKLIVNKAPLTVRYKWDEVNSKNQTIEKYYGQLNPEVDATKITFDGWAYDADRIAQEGTDADAKPVKGTLRYVQTTENANYNYAGTAPLTVGTTTPAPAQLYNCTFSGLTSDNYELDWPDNKMMIKQADLAAALAANKLTIAQTSKAEFTYDGTVPTTVYSVKFTDASDVEHTLTRSTTAAADYTVSYTYNTAAAGDYGVTTDLVPAGYYKAFIAAEANSNYYTATPIAVPFTGTLTYSHRIKPADLWVYVMNITKTYDGEEEDLAGATFEFNGLAAVDDNTTTRGHFATDLTAKYNSGAANTHKAVKKEGYKLKPELKATPVYITKNYNVIPLTNGKLIVNPRPIEVYAQAEEINFGEDAPATFTYALQKYSATPSADPADHETDAAAGYVNADDKDALELAITAGLKDAATTDYTAANTYENAIVLFSDDAEIPATGVEIQNYIVTPVAANYVVKGVKISLIAENKKITYGDAVPVLGAPLTEYDGDLGTISYTLTSKADPNISFDYEEGMEDILPAGLYSIDIVKNVTNPAGYDGITYVPGTLTVDKKKVYVKVDAVSINRLADVNALNTLGTSKVSFVATAAGTTSALVGNDKIGFGLAFHVDGTNPEAVTVGTDAGDADTYRKLTSDVNTTVNPSYLNGYEVVELSAEEIAEGGFANDNYLYTVDGTHYYSLSDFGAVTPGSPAPILGPVVVLAADKLILNRTADDLLAVLTAASTHEYDVTFANERTLKAQKWYSMVLPFAISVPKLSHALGYAIVNRFNQTTSDGNVHFNLAWGTIPANEPFLLKVQGTETAPGVFADVDLNTIEFTDVTITAPDATGLESIKNGDDIEFIGVYKKHYDLVEGDKFYAWSEANQSDLQRVGSNATWLNPFASYWKAPAAARIFVEDLNSDGTTAIKEVDAQTMNEIAADGWYTLNGVKLQSVPTEKGVYINNGKKVVIK